MFCLSDDPRPEVWPARQQTAVSAGHQRDLSLPPSRGEHWRSGLLRSASIRLQPPVPGPGELQPLRDGLRQPKLLRQQQLHHGPVRHQCGPAGLPALPLQCRGAAGQLDQHLPPVRGAKPQAGQDPLQVVEPGGGEQSAVRPDSQSPPGSQERQERRQSVREDRRSRRGR